MNKRNVIIIRRLNCSVYPSNELSWFRIDIYHFDKKKEREKTLLNRDGEDYDVSKMRIKINEHQSAIVLLYCNNFRLSLYVETIIQEIYLYDLNSPLTLS